MNGQNNFLFSTDLSENTELSLTNFLEEATTIVKDLLQQAANSPDFDTTLQIAFGNNINPDILKESWTAGEFVFPEIEIVNRADINNANGAFARETNKIYLAQEFLLANINNLDAVRDVVLEEYGHFVDSQLNVIDAPGDEGAIFAALVRGEELGEGELQQLRNEDDSAVVILDGKDVAIEQNDNWWDAYDSSVISQRIDYDNDGDLDLLRESSRYRRSSDNFNFSLYENSGNDTFATEPNYTLELPYNNPSFTYGNLFDSSFETFMQDYDGDGDLDLLVGEYFNKVSGSFANGDFSIYRNDGNNNFSLVFETEARNRFWGILDSYNSSENVVSSYVSESQPTGVWMFDYHNDGDLDIFFGDGKFYDPVNNYSSAYSLRDNSENYYSDGEIFADYDNDGDVDILVSYQDKDLSSYFFDLLNSQDSNITSSLTGATFRESIFQIHRNDGNEGFTTLEKSGYGSWQTGDPDRDGDVDLWLESFGEDYPSDFNSYLTSLSIQFFENTGNGLYSSEPLTISKLPFDSLDYELDSYEEIDEDYQLLDYDNDGDTDAIIVVEATLPDSDTSQTIIQIYQNKYNSFDLASEFSLLDFDRVRWSVSYDNPYGWHEDYYYPSPTDYKDGYVYGWQEIDEFGEPIDKPLDFDNNGQKDLLIEGENDTEYIAWLYKEFDSEPFAEFSLSVSDFEQYTEDFLDFNIDRIKNENIDFYDYDRDGDLDVLFEVEGRNPDGKDPKISRIYHNDGSKGFSLAAEYTTDIPARTAITINDVIVEEKNVGVTKAIFGVSLSDAVIEPVTVDFITENITASTVDYEPNLGTLIFEPGETEKTIKIEVRGDRDFEENESFAVKLRNASNAIIVDSRGQGTILDDDLDPNGDVFIPSIDQIYEFLSKDAAYKDWQKDRDLDKYYQEIYGANFYQEVFGENVANDFRLNYKIDKIFEDSSNNNNKKFTGFYGIGLKSTNGAAPVLVLRGTEKDADDRRDIFSDFQADGIGIDQFDQNKQPVIDWLTNAIDVDKELFPDITGHSLGGALAQWIASEQTGRINGQGIGNVITFNSPGISSHVSPQGYGARLFRKESSDRVTHHLTSSDIVSLAGEEFIEGNYILHYRDSYDENKTAIDNLVDFKAHLTPILIEKVGYDSLTLDGALEKLSGEFSLPPEKTNFLNNKLFSYESDSDFVPKLITNLNREVAQLLKQWLETAIKTEEVENILKNSINQSSEVVIDSILNTVGVPTFFGNPLKSALEIGVDNTVEVNLDKLAPEDIKLSLLFGTRGATEKNRKFLGEVIEYFNYEKKYIAGDSPQQIISDTFFQKLNDKIQQAVKHYEVNQNNLNFKLREINNLDLSTILEQVKEKSESYLIDFAKTDRSNTLNQAFGEKWNNQIAQHIFEQWETGDFSNIPTINVIPASEIAGNNGAYELETGNIYLAEEFISENTEDIEKIASVLLEEIGHHLDSLINELDAIGDEGEIFSNLVRGIELSDEQLQQLLEEDDLLLVAQSTSVLNTITQWSDEAWDASTEWTDEAWDAIANWSDADWQETTEWTDEQWQESKEWTKEEWFDTIDKLFPLQVADFQKTSTGLTVQFNQQIDPELLHSFGQQSNIALNNNNNESVNGSLVWDEDTYTLTFVKTGGVLESNIYNLTVESSEDGLKSQQGMQLDGNGDETEGDDYTKIFAATIEQSDRIISIPDLTLAPGATTDIPITLDNVEGITKLEFDFYYDTDLLDITAVNSNDNLPANWQLTKSEIDRDNGIVNVTIEGTDALTGDNLNIVNLAATVPDTAGYGETQILDLDHVVLNDGNVSAVDDDGIHQVIKAGDTTGDGTLSGLDAYQMMRVSVGLDDGFDNFSTVDPIISADINQDGVISAFDAYRAIK